MFFALGLIGYLFACWAPGYVATVMLGLKSRLPPLAGPFAISLILNNLLVEAMVAARLYRQVVLLPLAALTLAAAALLLLFDERLSRRNLELYFSTAGARLAHFTGARIGRAIASACIGLIAVLVAGAVLWSGYAHMGGAIMGYDSIVSWNRWARDWAADIYPRHIWHYPQLLPVLWSIPYVTSGNSDIQYFSSSFKILFWLLSFETLAFVAWRRRDAIQLLGVPVLYFLFHFWVGPTAMEDYADIPVAFFALLSVAVLLAADTTELDARTLVPAVMFAAGAAMTKQVGFYMLAAVPTLILVGTYDAKRHFAPVREMAYRLVTLLVLAILAAAPIYFYAIVTIREGTNTSELSYILGGIFNGLTYSQRVAQAFLHLFGGGMPRKIACLIIVMAAFASIRDRTFRWVLLLISVPFILIWAANFSYDNRNLALAIPFWALCAAAGFSGLLRRASPQPALWPAPIRPMWERIHVLPVALVLALAGFALVKSERLSFPALLARQQEIARAEQGGDQQCTEKMISLLRTFSAGHRIFSEWRWACTFHFNDSNYCTRLLPNEFSTAREMLPEHSGADLLLILNRTSLTPARATMLRAAGLKPAGEAMCDVPSVFFFRHSAP